MPRFYEAPSFSGREFVHNPLDTCPPFIAVITIDHHRRPAF